MGGKGAAVAFALLLAFVAVIADARRQVGSPAKSLAPKNSSNPFKNGKNATRSADKDKCLNLGRRCGKDTAYVCPGFQCCSANGFCGMTVYHCLTKFGCQDSFTRNKCKKNARQIGKKPKVKDTFGQVKVRTVFNAAPVCRRGNCPVGPALKATKSGKVESPAKRKIKAQLEKIKAKKLEKQAETARTPGARAAFAKAAKNEEKRAEKDNQKANDDLEAANDAKDLREGMQTVLTASQKMKATAPVIAVKLSNFAEKLKRKAKRIEKKRSLRALSNRHRLKKDRKQKAIAKKQRRKEIACINYKRVQKAKAKKRDMKRTTIIRKLKKRMAKLEQQKVEKALKEEQQRVKDAEVASKIKTGLDNFQKEKDKLVAQLSMIRAEEKMAKQELGEKQLMLKQAKDKLEQLQKNGLPVAARKRCRRAAKQMKLDHVRCKSLARASARTPGAPNSLDRDCLLPAKERLRLACREYNGWRATKKFPHKPARLNQQQPTLAPTLAPTAAPIAANATGNATDSGNATATNTTKAANSTQTKKEEKREKKKQAAISSNSTKPDDEDTARQKKLAAEYRKKRKEKMEDARTSVQGLQKDIQALNKKLLKLRQNIRSQRKMIKRVDDDIARLQTKVKAIKKKREREAARAKNDQVRKALRALDKEISKDLNGNSTKGNSTKKGNSTATSTTKSNSKSKF